MIIKKGTISAALVVSGTLVYTGRDHTSRLRRLLDWNSVRQNCKTHGLEWIIPHVSSYKPLAMIGLLDYGTKKKAYGRLFCASQKVCAKEGLG